VRKTERKDDEDGRKHKGKSKKTRAENKVNHN